MNKYIFIFLLFVLNIQPQERTLPYVLLISFDGFRWDYPNRGLSPNLEEMSRAGVSALSLRPIFPSKTFPNHYSIVTGMSAEHHGLMANSFENPLNGEWYSLGDTISVRDGKWYWGEAIWETLEKNDITTASYFWPGSEVKDEGRHPTYFKKYQHDKPYGERIETVFNWLAMPYDKRPHFICLYFDRTDGAGHGYGPDSREVKSAITELDSLLSVIRKKSEDAGMKDSLNIILVSDHGMTETAPDKVINVEELLEGFTCKYSDSGPVMHIKSKGKDIPGIMEKLSAHPGKFSAFTREQIPEYYKIKNHPYLKDILVIAEMGWSLVSQNSSHYSYSSKVGGNHGYDNYHTDMHGIFYALGPAFKQNYRTGTLSNLDIYPLICKIFGVQPSAKADGKINNIEYILK